MWFHIEADQTHRAMAKHYDVPVKFVNDMAKLKREIGALTPKI